MNHFQSRFKKEYLPALQDKHHSKIRRLRRVVQIGDIVYLHEDRIPKNLWPMGKVIRLLKRKDDIERAVELRTHDKTGKSISIKRHIQHLYPLEIPRGVQEEFEEYSVQEHITKEPTITLIQNKDVLQRKV